MRLTDSNRKFNDLKSGIDKLEHQIELLKGNNIFRINISDIQFAKIEFGTVWVYFEKNYKAVYSGTLNDLNSLLPSFLFFRTTRNSILRRDIILSISPSTYGKIDLKLKETIVGEDNITVSRPKASQFRKWYYSNSNTK